MAGRYHLGLLWRYREKSGVIPPFPLVFRPAPPRPGVIALGGGGDSLHYNPTRYRTLDSLCRGEPAVNCCTRNVGAI